MSISGKSGRFVRAPRRPGSDAVELSDAVLDAGGDGAFTWRVGRPGRVTDRLS